ncbi:MAG: DUF262 domain-containing protein [Desulfobacteraceae bacterium]|nr:DUF262 domain-containing protein [Desulfobacteraceae bacterium]
MDKTIEKLENLTFEEDDSPEVPPADIVAYNESRSCADLFRMYNQGILEIQPEFQREIVWKSPAQTRFIDSLTKQLPIPSMCFSMDHKTLRWKVIDGLQRMASIIRFLSGDPTWILSRLDDIDQDLSGKSAKSFLNPDSSIHHFYRRVENLTLPITVLRCDYSKKSNTNYLFTIFHRLNTGAMKLNNQEIRNCIYSGALNNLLKDLNKNTEWMRLNKMKKEVGFRFTKEELILRFFAFYDQYKEYGGRLAKFLNEYMADNRNLDDTQAMEKKELFERTVRLVFMKLFDGKAPTKTPISVIEATLVGVAKNIDTLEEVSPQDLKSKYSSLFQHEEFSDQKLSEGLSGKLRVTGRLDAAINIFS